MDEKNKQIEKEEKHLEVITNEFEANIKFFNFSKDDDKCKTTEAYFKFWKDVFESIVKSMPKEEKKRAGAAKGGTRGGKVMRWDLYNLYIPALM